MRILIGLITLFLVGCKTIQVVPTALDGSKVDGVIELGYEVTSGLDTYEVDWIKGGEEAIKRCQAWGYKSADPFGGIKNECTRYHDGDCLARTYFKKYQCI